MVPENQPSRLFDLFNFNGPSVLPLKPFLIAEAGVNHEGNLSLAKRLIEEAAESGADCIKFQTYKADNLAVKKSPAYWDLSAEPTKSQNELFKKYDKFWKSEYEKLALWCSDYKIQFLSTAFDIDSAKFLNDLMDSFKVSSSDLNNLPFIEHLCQYNKPIILSVGASYDWEIERTVSLIKSNNNELALMHCILNYPTKSHDARLGRILELQKRYPGGVVGYSDHTMPEDMKVLEMAALLGAKIIEKHFTFDKTLPGNDHYHSMDKHDIKNFLTLMERNRLLFGNGSYDPLSTEEVSRLNARRSLVFSKELSVGAVVSTEDLTWKRPGTGISPSEIGQIVGKQLVRSVSQDELVSWKHFYV